MENQEAKAAEQSQGPRTALTAHTPGPWIAENFRSQPNANGLRGSRIIAPGEVGREDRERHVAQVANHPGINTDMARANARLIAAAPDMLAALESIASLLGGQLPDYARAGHDIARAAIKATEPK